MRFFPVRLSTASRQTHSKWLSAHNITEIPHALSRFRRQPVCHRTRVMSAIPGRLESSILSTVSDYNRLVAPAIHIYKYSN